MELTILREKTVLIARMAALKQGMAADFDSKRFFFLTLGPVMYLRIRLLLLIMKAYYVYVHSHNVRSRHIM